MTTRTECLKYRGKPRLRNPAFLVCWAADAGQLGPGVSIYLRQHLRHDLFCEIEPVEFFPLGGVSIEDDVVTFPESSFYAMPDRDLVLFHSAIPRYEWFRFLNVIMDVAQDQYRARELYTIGGMVTLAPHTADRNFWATFNSSQMKKALAPFELSREMDFETPPGGRPTLNSFALWTARQRGLQGANLWVPVPFYLAASADPRGQKRILEFLDKRLELGLDLTWMDAAISSLDAKIVRLRQEQPEIDTIIAKLESQQQITEADHEKIVKEVEEYLRGAS